MIWPQVTSSVHRYENFNLKKKKTGCNFLISCQFLNRHSVLQTCRINSLKKYPLIEPLNRNSYRLSPRWIPQHCRAKQRHFGTPVTPVTRAATNKSMPTAKTTAWPSRRPLAIAKWSLRSAINLLQPRQIFKPALSPDVEARTCQPGSSNHGKEQHRQRYRNTGTPKSST